MGFLHCPWEVILQHLSSITATPKDWCWAPQCHRVPLSPIEIPEGQAKENLLLCLARLPTGWGEGEKLVHCGSDKESFPSRHLLPNWEPDMESRWEATLHIHCGHNLQWALNFWVRIPPFAVYCPPHPPYSFACSFIHSPTLTGHWILSIEDTVVNKLQKSLVLLHSRVVLFSMIDNNYVRLFTFKVINIKF